MKGKQASCVFDYCVFHTVIEVKKVERKVVVEVLKGIEIIWIPREVNKADKLM